MKRLRFIIPRSILALTLTFSAPVKAGLIASATVTEAGPVGGNYTYDVTLNDIGSTTAGTLWFAWVPGEDFMPFAPTNISSPTGWTDVVTHGGGSDGYAIRWVASSPSFDLMSGQSLTGFHFDSAMTPAELAGDSTFFPATPTGTSFVYSQGPFSDAGFELIASSAPEPGTWFTMLAGLGLLVFFARRPSATPPA